MNKCNGCGALLQSYDDTKEGYTKNTNHHLCERCFRIIHYNDYKLISKDNRDFIDILKKINGTSSLVVLVVDLFNIPKNIEEIKKYINNDLLLVLTKRDLLPLSVYDSKLIDYFKKFHLNIVDTVIISSLKNYHFDDLLDKIRNYQKDKNVYIVGFTNAGKSTMINKILYNYTNSDTIITTSMLPSTTIDSIKIEIDDHLTLIDTPGLLDTGNIIDNVSVDLMKKIVPVKEIKPKTYQIKTKQILLVDDILRLDLTCDNSLTFYMANTLEITRVYKETTKLAHLVRHDLDVKSYHDIVITGLGFIKCVKACHVILYTLAKVDVYVRESLI